MYLLYLNGTNEGPFEGSFVLLLSIAIAMHTELYGKFRKAFPKATTPIKMHLLEHHTLQWANRMHVGFGLLAEQGAKSMHEKFTSLLSQNRHA